MHKYFKELDINGNIVGHCSITGNKKYIEEYKNSKCIKVVEISEKEYDRLRKALR
jgi:hypothetical protein